MNKTANRYAQLFALMKRHGLEKDEVLEHFFDGKIKSLKELSDRHLAELVLQIVKTYGNTPPPGQIQRQKMFSLAKNMRWGKTTKAIRSALDEWLLKQKYKKPLMRHTVPELNLMLAVLEQKVYAEYLESFHK